ncbi:MAG: methyl-accepting chemotaxis protein [Gemmatimonadetes bacterium]|nr:MAG: methyl-accepting chemotaxis protein [Gemmatimonadota bacterium]
MKSSSDLFYGTSDSLTRLFFTGFRWWQDNYLTIALPLMKANTFIAAILGYFYAQINMPYISEHRFFIISILFITSLLFLMGLRLFTRAKTPHVKPVIQSLLEDKPVEETAVEQAWQEVIDLPARFFVFQLISAFFVIAIPTILIVILFRPDIPTAPFIKHSLVASAIVITIISTVDFFIMEQLIFPIIHLFHSHLRGFHHREMQVVTVRVKVVFVVLLIVLSAFLMVGTVSYQKAADIAQADAAQTEIIKMELKNNMIAMALVSIILTTILALLLARSIHFPVVSVQRAVQEIISGDLTRRVPVVSRDEFGMLTSYFNQMTDHLENLVKRINDSWHQLDSTAEILAMIAQGQSAQLESQSNSIVNATSTMEELASTSAQVAGGAKQVVEIANRTETSSQKGLRAMGEMNAGVRQIDQKNNEVIAKLADLKTKFENIYRVMDLIRDIADRTKFIALNASIEAAGAGAVGKRFEVVAKEVRDLASKTADAVQEMRGIIQEITVANNELGISSEAKTHLIFEGVHLTEVTLKALQEIATEAETTASSARQISNAVIQQNAASDQMVTLLHEISEGIQEVADSGRDANTITQELQNLSNRLREAIQTFQHS